MTHGITRLPGTGVLRAASRLLGTSTTSDLAGSVSTSRQVRVQVVPIKLTQRRRPCKHWAATKAAKMLLSGPGDWTRLHDDRRWHRRADGAGPSSIQERTVRRLRRDPLRVGADPAKRNGGITSEDVVARLIAALQPDYVVLGGGNAHKLKELPPNCRMGRKQHQCVPRRVSLVGGARRTEGPSNVLIGHC